MKSTKLLNPDFTLTQNQHKQNKHVCQDWWGNGNIPRMFIPNQTVYTMLDGKQSQNCIPLPWPPPPTPWCGAPVHVWEWSRRRWGWGSRGETLSDGPGYHPAVRILHMRTQWTLTLTLLHLDCYFVVSSSWSSNCAQTNTLILWVLLCKTPTLLLTRCLFIWISYAENMITALCC